MVNEGLDSVNWPANCLNSDDKVAQIRSERQKKREMMEALQAAESLGKTAQRTSKTIEEGSPMEAITSAMGKMEGAKA